MIVCATAKFYPPQVDGAMASCLRNLPAEAQTLIDEMGQHWRDLEQLKAAGGTPAARCVKAFEFSHIASSDAIFIEARGPEGTHVRKCQYDMSSPCRVCARVLRWIGDDDYCGRCGVRPKHSKSSWWYLSVKLPNNSERGPRNLWGVRP